MKLVSCYILVFLVVVGASCDKKKYPDPEVIENEAVYYSKLLINNVPVTLEAGRNDYYMYSSYKQDSNNVYALISDLKQINCSSCPKSLKIQINDSRISAPNGSIKIDSALRVQKYSYLSGGITSSYEAHFESSYNKSSGTYLWNFGDGQTSTLPNPVHYFNTKGTYNVCVTVTNAQSCVSNLCNTQRIGSVSSDFRTFISTGNSSGTSVTFMQTTTGGTGPYQFFWDFGDGIKSTNPTPVHNYRYRGSYAVTLKVVDANGDVITSNYNAVTQNDPSSCAVNYKLTSFTPVQLNVALSNVIVTWTDENGNVYTSNNALQPTDGYFEILSVEDNQMNENNQLTKKLRVKFKCKVYNDSKMLSIDNAEATICVAYK